MTAEFDRCVDTTAAGTRCKRLGTYTIPQVLERGRCRQHAIAKAHADGLRQVLDMRSLESINALEVTVTRRRRTFIKPTTYDEVMAALPKLRYLAELVTVIGVVIDNGKTFPGFGDRDSALRCAIRDTRQRLKRSASAAEISQLSPGWEPKGVGAIAAQRMRTAGVEVPHE